MREMLTLFPKSIKVLQLFGTFQADVLNDMKG
jgi:transcriptional regulator with PAS, ATPase and Fis domain